ncbi:hypothetical protein O181_091893 [Austropuccinia psidii MF-1]|uniref:Yeast cell wall synthesis Kre9/Knh1-like N-terminal domain-containing protein n=1 Tax=Austropuccinia psidii MF-1 TaxID=1389203 RepID=A0A9Q3IY83_9BASI|nr:hypothetical protein [Austropuccinia psidii MF-1]
MTAIWIQLSLLLSLACLGSTFTINNPSSSAYWVQFATNTIAWSNGGSDPSQVSLQIVHPNKTILNGVFAITEFVPTSLESFTVTNVTLLVSDGYIVQMVNTTNNTQVYTSSAPFSVKPNGTAPATLPGSSGGSTASNSTGSTNTNSSNSPTASRNGTSPTFGSGSATANNGPRNSSSASVKPPLILSSILLSLALWIQFMR